VITKEELRRLQKALKDGRLMKLKEWASGLGTQLNSIIAKDYKEHYEKVEADCKKYYEDKAIKELAEMMGYYDIAIVYTLHFNEKCKFGTARIADFMGDLFTTVDYFRTGEYSPEDYIEQLKKENIEVEFKN